MCMIMRLSCPIPIPDAFVEFPTDQVASEGETVTFPCRFILPNLTGPRWEYQQLNSGSRTLLTGVIFANA